VNKSPFDDGFMKDMKDQMFKKPKKTGFEGPGADVRWEMSLDLHEAVLGAEKELSFQTKVKCQDCDGLGNVKSTTIRCSKCKGWGRFKVDKTVTVKVPPGVVDGSVVRLKEQGEHGNPPGNLMVRCGVPMASATIRRDGNDLYSDVRVSQSELDNGTSVTVTTIEGNTGSLKVPPNTKAGAALRIKGRGAPVVLGSMEERGDHFFCLTLK